MDALGAVQRETQQLNLLRKELETNGNELCQVVEFLCQTSFPKSEGELIISNLVLKNITLKYEAAAVRLHAKILAIAQRKLMNVSEYVEFYQSNVHGIREHVDRKISEEAKNAFELYEKAEKDLAEYPLTRKVLEDETNYYKEIKEAHRKTEDAKAHNLARLKALNEHSSYIMESLRKVWSNTFPIDTDKGTDDTKVLREIFIDALSQVLATTETSQKASTQAFAEMLTSNQAALEKALAQMQEITTKALAEESRKNRESLKEVLSQIKRDLTVPLEALSETLRGESKKTRESLEKALAQLKSALEAKLVTVASESQQTRQSIKTAATKHDSNLAQLHTDIEALHQLAVEVHATLQESAQQSKHEEQTTQSMLSRTQVDLESSKKAFVCELSYIMNGRIGFSFISSATLEFMSPEEFSKLKVTIKSLSDKFADEATNARAQIKATAREQVGVTQAVFAYNESVKEMVQSLRTCLSHSQVQFKNSIAEYTRWSKEKFPSLSDHLNEKTAAAEKFLAEIVEMFDKAIATVKQQKVDWTTIL